MNQDYSATGFKFALLKITRTLNAVAFRDIFPGLPIEKDIKTALRVGGVQDLNLYTVGFVVLALLWLEKS